MTVVSSSPSVRDLLVSDYDIRVTNYDCASAKCRQSCIPKVRLNCGPSLLSSLYSRRNQSCSRCLVQPSYLTPTKLFRFLCFVVSGPWVCYALRPRMVQRCTVVCFNFWSPFSQTCRLCHPCLKESERAFLKQALLEHRNRGSFRRVYPPPMVRLFIQWVWTRFIFNVYLISQSVNQSINQSVSQSVNQSINQSIM